MAARGIHVDNVSHVINFDLPNVGRSSLTSSQIYIHPDWNGDIFAGNEDIDLSVDSLDGGVISTVSFTVPQDTVSGESLMFDPAGDVQYFALGIQ